VIGEQLYFTISGHHHRRYPYLGWTPYPAGDFALSFNGRLRIPPALEMLVQHAG